MANFLEGIKKAAMDAYRNSDPTCIMYGKVTKLSPLSIQVNPKLTLEGEQLVLTRNVTDFETEVTIDWTTETALTTHSHGVGGVSVAVTSEENPDEKHNATISGNTDTADLAHTHAISGKKTIKIHNALKVGDEVIMIRQSGGQEYIVLDRVG